MRTHEQHVDDWLPCARCGAATFLTGRALCFVHEEAERRAEYLVAWSEFWRREDAILPSTASLDLRGTRIGQAELDEILAHAPRKDGLPTLLGIRFDRARFGTPIHLRAHFGSGATFLNTIFTDDCRFGGSLFGPDSTFFDCQFLGQADFGDIRTLGRFTISQTLFAKRSTFSSARFGGQTLMNQLTIAEDMRFNGVTFEDDANFEWMRSAPGGQASFVASRARFRGSFSMQESRLNADRRHDLNTPDALRFDGSIFEGSVNLRDLHTVGDVRLEYVELHGPLDLRKSYIVGSLLFDGAQLSGSILMSEARIRGERMSLREASFLTPVSLEVECGTLDLSYSRFLEGGSIRVAAHAIELLGATVRPTLRIQGAGQIKPQLPSLRAADVGGLALSGVDLESCTLTNTFNLEGAAIDSDVSFRTFRGRAVTRIAVAEEIGWRELRAGLGARTRAAIRRNPELREPIPRIASVYRGLRLGREARGDSAGSSDFYYGEMEMRRLGSRGVDALILQLSWALAGYTLRPFRAFLAFLIGVVASGLATAAWGLQNPPLDPIERLLVGVLAGASNAVSIFGGTDDQTTTAGRLIAILLSLWAPSVLALLVLSLRNQIRR